MTTDAKILSALRANPDGVSGAELAEQLGISRAAIWAHIEELRQLGYDIEAGPHFGYRLVSAPDALHADDLLARLGKTKIIGRDIHVFEQTTSTNDVIEKLARDGVKEGVVVFAESQTKGRGRLGRKWISPARQGALVFRFAAAGFASAGNDAVDRRLRHGPAPRHSIRNRFGPGNQMAERHFDSGRKKVAGILTEMSAELDRVRHVILGIGVDVNLGAGEFPAELRKTGDVAENRSGPEPFPAPELATAILRELDHDYARVCGGQFADVADEWEAHCTTIGRDGDDSNRRAAGAAAGPNRWTTTARCCCGPNTAIWSASPAAM